MKKKCSILTSNTYVCTKKYLRTKLLLTKSQPLDLVGSYKNEVQPHLTYQF